MDVEIGQLTSTVRAVDGHSLLTPQVMQTILAAVTQAMKDRESQEKRAQVERQITGGVSRERDEER